jgi:hypothetical protein
MNAALLMRALQRCGVQLEADGELLVVDAPAGIVTDELKAVLSEHKAQLISAVQVEQRFLRSERGQDDDGRRFDAKPSGHPGYTCLYDPIHDEWHDFPTKDCYPSIVELAGKRKKEGGAA